MCNYKLYFDTLFKNVIFTVFLLIMYTSSCIDQNKLFVKLS